MSTPFLVLVALVLGLAASIPITILPPRYSGWSFLPTVGACVVGSLLGGLGAALLDGFKNGTYPVSRGAMVVGAGALGLAWHRFVRPRPPLLAQ